MEAPCEGYGSDDLIYQNFLYGLVVLSNAVIKENDRLVDPLGSATFLHKSSQHTDEDSSRYSNESRDGLLPSKPWFRCTTSSRSVSPCNGYGAPNRDRFAN